MSTTLSGRPSTESQRNRLATYAIWLSAVGGPVLLTAVLVRLNSQQQRDYVFLYLGLVAVVGVVRGLWPALSAALVSFLLVDWFFVPPVGTLTIADEQDIANLLAFLGIAGLVGLLANRRRETQLRAEALARQLREVNAELVRLNKEQAQAAQAELRLARSEQQIRALQEADRVRQELLANVSHELRTPLGTILAESTSGKPNRDRMETIASEARRLKALVDDMLDMARIEARALRLELEPVRLGDAVAAAIERLERNSPQRKVDWDPRAGEAVVLADWHRVGQVLDNLLANADRFSPEGRPIAIRADLEKPGLVTVSIADRGPGVASDLLDRLFERFVRGESQAGLPGTGLGLAIVKGLVEAHAGSVWLEEPRSGSGAVFRFTLPLAADQQ
ncbi:MAG TPA: ATP-binding protein [Candidatus Dormibacteraeota bacterium]|nr:ATP-binding protein [Candidatus Dormibacteraeota bacterium]